MIYQKLDGFDQHYENTAPPVLTGQTPDDAYDQASAQHCKIGTSECVQVPEAGRVSQLSTGGISCCVVVAMRGVHHQTGAVEVMLTHLDSQQYTPPGGLGADSLGGKTDAQLQADDDMRQARRAQSLQETRNFSRTHHNLETIAATNYLDNPLNIGQCLYLKTGMAPKPEVYFLDEPDVKGGAVALDVPSFQFYKTDPNTGARLELVNHLMPLVDAQAEARLERMVSERTAVGVSALWRSCLSWSCLSWL